MGLPFIASLMSLAEENSNAGFIAGATAAGSVFTLLAVKMLTAISPFFDGVFSLSKKRREKRGVCDPVCPIPNGSLPREWEGRIVRLEKDTQVIFEKLDSQTKLLMDIALKVGARQHR